MASASGSEAHVTDENLSRTAANIVDVAVTKHVSSKKKSHHQGASASASASGRKSHAPGPGHGHSKKSHVDVSRKSTLAVQKSRSKSKSKSNVHIQESSSGSKKSIKNASRKSNAQPKTILEEYEELLELGNCLECEWTKNYHPCLQSGSENNEKCKEEMRKRGFDYKEPVEKCRKESSKHEHGYQSGHFYALNKKSHLDDEEQGEIVHEHFDVHDPLGARKSLAKLASSPSGQMKRSKSLHETESQKRKSRKSQVSPSKSGMLHESESKKSRKSQATSPSPSKTGSGGGSGGVHKSESKTDGKSRPTSTSPSKTASSTYMANKSMLARQSMSIQEHAHYHATKQVRDTNDSDEEGHLSRGSPSSHANLHKTPSKAKSKKSKAHRDKDVENASLEYINKLHPQATGGSEIIARDNLVPVPSDLGIKKAESKGKFKTTPEEFDCSRPSNKNSAICKPHQKCSFNKNYHPCNNTTNKEDAELCRLWVKERGIAASERMLGKPIGLQKTVSGTTTTTPSEMIEIDEAVDGAIGGAKDNLGNKKKIIIKGQGERDEEGLVLCAPDTPFSEMSEAQVRKLVQDLISTAKREQEQRADD